MRANRVATVTSPAAFPPPPTPFPEAEPPPAPDFVPGADTFALELRAETIEQLSGGNALRRGEHERVEVGGSDGNADRIAGRERVQVEDKLVEHTGHGLTVQAAHLETTVDGSSDTWAGKEDTMLLAGHMRDTWNRGSATVAALCDDLAAGGGVRINALDLWVHGLMGLEERPGTCAADGVLAEACGTLYEREYRTAVHAAGLAVFNGTLYQSVRNSFRPLMRISTGVRNLIAGGGGSAGGEAPPASPPPAADEAGAEGAEAACATLDAGRGAAVTPPAGIGAVHLDDTAVLTREADIIVVSAEVTELNRSADTAERLGGLRNALRRAESGDEAASGSGVSRVEDAASEHSAGSAQGLLDGRPATVALDPDVPASRVDDPRARGIEVKHGLLPVDGDPPRRTPDEFDWQRAYMDMNNQHYVHQRDHGGIASRAYGEAISEIDAKVMEAFVGHRGRIGHLKRDTRDGSMVEGAYRALQGMASRAEGAVDAHRTGELRQTLADIDRLTAEWSDRLFARAPEFHKARVEANQGRPLDPRIDRQKLDNWLKEQLAAANRRYTGPWRSGDKSAWDALYAETQMCVDLQDSVLHGRDPRFDSYGLTRSLADTGRAIRVEAAKSLHARLMDAMADPSMYVASMQGSEMAGAAPALFPAPSPGRAGGLGDTAGGPDPTLAPRVAGPSSSVRAGVDAGGAVAVTTPQLGGESALWPHPGDRVPSSGTVRFDTDHQSAGRQPPAPPQHPGAAAHPPFVRDPEDILDASHLFVTSSWARDAFEVERALIDGRLPPKFDASGLSRQWRQLAEGTALARPLESELLPTGIINRMIEGYQAEDARRHAPLIQKLEAMRESFDRALTRAYGYRVDADWLARVGEFLKTGSTWETAGGVSVPAPSRGGDVVEAARTSSRPARVESVAVPGRTEGGAGALSLEVSSPVDLSPGDLSPGAWSTADMSSGAWSPGALSPGDLSPGAQSPAQGPWRVGSPEMRSEPRRVRFGDGDVVHFDATAPASSVGAGRRGMAVDESGGWRAVETPGFARLTSGSGERPFSRREAIVHRLMSGDALFDAELARRTDGAGALGWTDTRWQAVLDDVYRVNRAAATDAVAAAAMDDIDWRALEVLVGILDVPSLR